MTEQERLEMSDQHRQDRIASICTDWVYGQVDTETAMRAILRIASPAWTPPGFIGMAIDYETEIPSEIG